MPRINLITERRKKEQRETLVARLLMYGCGVLAGAFVLVFFVTTATIWRRGGQINDATQRLQKLQVKIEQVKDLQRQVAQMEPKLQLLQTAQDSTKRWYLIYQQTGQGLPLTSWLESINVNHDERAKQDTLVLAGQSLSQRTVADTISQLQRQPMFGQVDLHSVTQNGPPTDQSSIHPVHFEVAVQLKQPQRSNNVQATAKN